MKIENTLPPRHKDTKNHKDNFLKNLSETSCLSVFVARGLKLVCDLAGSYQTKNITTVLQTIELLNSEDFKISDLDMKTGLANVSSLTGLKGRWQVLNEAPLTICDTAHNEEGIRLVVEQINSLNFNNLHFVLGVVNDKEIDGLLKMLPKKAFYYF
ncbi:MAG: bifunctional folylpolyglutamate synthase/dihydrofolate synthase, partial [Bacteroidetes bacterium]|nr:bifunctional folylpolyglutamate synthase/dihydrofolate synthase [Bacteroidota bacterium]